MPDTLLSPIRELPCLFLQQHCEECIITHLLFIDEEESGILSLRNPSQDTWSSLKKALQLAKPFSLEWANVMLGWTYKKLASSRKFGWFWYFAFGGRLKQGTEALVSEETGAHHLPTNTKSICSEVPLRFPSPPQRGKKRRYLHLGEG